MVDISWVIGLGIALLLESVVFVFYVFDVKMDRLLDKNKAESWKMEYARECQRHLGTLAKTDELRLYKEKYESLVERLDNMLDAEEE